MKVQSHVQPEFNKAIGRIILSGGHAVVPNVNIHFADLACRQPWLRRCGGVWLGRLLIETRRLWKRYLIGNPLFLARVLRPRPGRVK